MINRLSAEVAAKIAAGEVVERPASVVKELIDNALDAGADHIVVEIQEGGSKRIRVTDNGSGMSPEDLRLCIERHATSKISRVEDLEAIASFGFRGEALASVAAVSKLEIVTRRVEDLEGSRLSCEGTAEPEINPIGCPEGTSLTVDELYFNTPARRKFLKSASTEFSHIASQVNRAAMVHPQVHFVLTHNGKQVADYPKVKTAGERVFALLGRSTWEQMQPLPEYTSQSDDSNGEIRLAGYLSLPTLSRNRADQVFFFVNDRYIQNRTLLAALMEAYRGLVHPGRYPAAVIMLYMDPATIDVNVHPQKMEIKFSNEQSVWRAVHGVVRQSLSQLERHGVPHQASEFPHDMGERTETDSSPKPVSSEDKAERKGAPVDDLRRAVDRFFEKKQQEDLAPRPQVNQKETEEIPPPDAPPQQSESQERPTTSFQQVDERADHTGSLPAHSQTQMFERDEKPIPLAQVLGTYIVCEHKGSLTLVDQHAAAERVRFEQLRAQYEKGQVTQQQLLFPINIEVQSGDIDFLERNIPVFNRFGFDIIHFGQNTFSISAIPAQYKMEGCEGLVKDLLGDLREIGERNSEKELEEKMLVSMACHRSVRSGDRLSQDEMQRLIDQLFKSEHPYTCPHGRPIMVALNNSQIERLFKRTGF